MSWMERAKSDILGVEIGTSSTIGPYIDDDGCVIDGDDLDDFISSLVRIIESKIAKPKGARKRKWISRPVVLAINADGSILISRE